MDYRNYQIKSEILQNQIKKSEAERQELEHKFHKMYQEKQACESAILKSLESQHRRMFEEKRRRAERNENLISELNRVNRQAAILAAKSERLRVLKKQYEQYLIGLWGVKRIQAPGQASSSRTSLVKPQTMSRYVNNQIQPYYDPTDFDNREYKSDLVRCLSATALSSPTYYATQPARYQNQNPNQQYQQFGEPQFDTRFYQLPNAIEPDNYNNTMSDVDFIEEQPTMAPAPSTAIQNLEKYDEMFKKLSPLPQEQQKPQTAQQPSAFDIKASKSFNPIRQQQTCEDYSNNNKKTKVSSSTSSTAVSNSGRQTKVPPTPRVKQKPIPSIIIHLSDDEDSEKEVPQNNRRTSIVKPSELQIPLNEIENFLSEDTPAILESTEVKRISTNTIYYTDPPPFIIMKSEELKTNMTVEPIVEVDEPAPTLTDDDEDDVDERKVSLSSTSINRVSPTQNFIIPKIIVEPQIETQIVSVHDSYENQQENVINSNRKPLELSNISSISLSANDDSTSLDSSAIYPMSSEDDDDGNSNQQEQQEDNINMNETTMEATYGRPSEPDTSSHRFSVDNVGKSIEEIINNNQKPDMSPTSIELNDKINKIYQKIEKIEDEYYGEKVKIVENFENSTENLKTIDTPSVVMTPNELNRNVENLEISEMEIVENVEGNIFQQNNPTTGNEENENFIPQTIEENLIKNSEIEGNDGYLNEANSNVDSSNFIYSEDDVNRQLINNNPNEWNQEVVSTNYEYQQPAYDNSEITPIQHQDDEQFDYNQQQFVNNPEDNYSEYQQQQEQPSQELYQTDQYHQQQQQQEQPPEAYNYYAETQPLVEENQYQQGQEGYQVYEGEQISSSNQIYQDENQLYQTEYITEQPNDGTDVNYSATESHDPNQNLSNDNIEQTSHLIDEFQYPNNTNFITPEYVNSENSQEEANKYDENQNWSETSQNDLNEYGAIEKNEFEQPENEEKYKTVEKYDTELDSYTTTTTTTTATTSSTTSITTNSNATPEPIKKKKSVEFADEIKLKDDNPIEPSKANEVVMLKKLLGDESDDNTARSNEKGSDDKEKDVQDESDFDFSTNSEANNN